MLYNVVHDQLTEKDPTTTAWDAAKSGMGSGKIGTLALASWAVSQMQLAAKTAGADPSSIGFMPYPAQVNGHFCSVVSPDYLEAVSIHSAHKAAARAWVDWFVDKCTYAQDQGLLPTLKTGTMPPELAAYQNAGVQFIELAQNDNAQISTIDNELRDRPAEAGLPAAHRRPGARCRRRKSGRLLRRSGQEMGGRGEVRRRVLTGDDGPTRHHRGPAGPR